MITTQMDMYTKNDNVTYLIGYTVSSKQYCLSASTFSYLLRHSFLLMQITDQVFAITFSKIINLDTLLYLFEINISYEFK